MSTSLNAVPKQRLSFGEVLGTWGKAVVGVLVAFLGSYSAVRTGGVSPGEWIGVASTTIGAGGVIWAVPKAPRWLHSYGKPTAGAITTALGVLGTAWAVHNDITTQHVIDAVVAGLLNFAGPAIVSNAASSDPVNTRGHLVPVSEEVKAALVAPGDTVVSTRSDGVVTVLPDSPGAQPVQMMLPTEDEDRF
jgi:hypothetical protein